MKIVAAKRSAALSLLMVMLCLPGPVAAQISFDAIVVFGTSISDPGNAFALLSDPAYAGPLTRPANTPPYDTLDELPVPDAPYARGGHHFSNGATWIEQFAQGLGLAGFARPVFQGNSQNAANYAVGGARATDFPDRVNLPDQVDAFLIDFGGEAPADALYAVELGSNDVRDALEALATGGDPEPIIMGALGAIQDHIGTLGLGARKFLFANVPNLGLLPAVQALGPIAAGLATQLAQGFNAGLDGLVGVLQGLPGIEIARLDVFTRITELHANPGAFGLRNVQTPCVTPETPPFTCTNPDTFLFWDGIHPTKAVHAIFAQDAATALASGP